VWSLSLYPKEKSAGKQTPEIQHFTVSAAIYFSTVLPVIPHLPEENVQFPSLQLTPEKLTTYAH